MSEPSTTLVESASDLAAPRPSSNPTCTWCGAPFPNIVRLLDHVDRRHLPAEPVVATPARRFAST
jgi:hypothetical protein